MKPDWNDAPEWAMWLAQHGDGSWWWYESKPKADIMYRYWSTRYQCKHSMDAKSIDKLEPTDCWMHTREQRPIELKKIKDKA